MFPENHHYGHATLLNRAARRDWALPAQAIVPILGRVQHGWQRGGGMRNQHLQDPAPCLLWSRRNLDAAKAEGGRDLVPIAAPFVYLPQAAGSPAQPRSLLAIPFHGWEKEGLSDDAEDYAGALEELRGDFDSVTVCLYWVEYGDATMRETFTRRGFEVVTMGHRNDNPEFLVRQRDLIARHAAVTSNRISTATFYALVSDRPFFLWGRCVGLSGSEDPRGEDFDAWQRAEFPQLTREGFDGGVRRSIGEAELGTEFRREPGELERVLGLGRSVAALRARVTAWNLGRGLLGG